MNSTIRGTLCFVAALLAAPQASAGLVISVLDTAEVIDFTGFDGSGFTPTPAAGQLDSDHWRVTGLSDGDGTFGGTHITGDFARGSSTGGVSTGGIYSFDTGGMNPSLGFQPAGSDMTPGELTLMIDNGTGQSISSIRVTYDVLFYNDQTRANSLDFAHSATDAAGSYTNIAGLNVVSPEAPDAVPSWVTVSRDTTIDVTVAGGDSYFLQWQGDDVSGGGSRDEFAIDNVTITLSASAVPEPSSWAALVTLGGLAFYRKRRTGNGRADKTTC